MREYQINKKNMKVVVFGAGFLGTRISQELNCRLVSKDEVDARNINQVGEFLDRERPDAIINAVGKVKGSGHIGIDWCKHNPEESIQGNTTAVEVLATEASKRNIHFTHLGSGCLYDGDKEGEGWTEEDNPTTYGRQLYINTKINAEKILMDLPTLIIRLRMPIDKFPHERNIIDKLLSYKKIHNGKNSVIVVSDMIRAMDLLISEKKTGVYNVANAGAISMAEIMMEYNWVVEPRRFEMINSEELNKITEEKRTTCVLNVDKLQGELRKLGWEMPSAKESITKCLEEYRKNKNRLNGQ